MTDREKNLMAEMAFRSASLPPAHKKPRKSHGGIIASATLLIALYIGGLYPDELLHAADIVSELAARAELSTPLDFIRKSGDFSENVNLSEGEDNNNYEYHIENEELMLSSGNRMPSSANEEMWVDDLLTLPETEASPDDPLPYPDILGTDGGIISQVTYSDGVGESYIDLPLGGQIRNVTKLSRSEVLEGALREPDFTVKLNAPENEPQILIMHTHTTECYEPEDRTVYDKDFLCRTTDSDRNMTAVGRAMQQVFEKNGIRTIHDETLHDYPSYNGSYDRSRETVKAILEKYPSIKVVLDVHRDAIERQDGSRIAPYTEIDGRGAAQVMIICGCDDGTMDMPDYMKNLSTASFFQQAIASRYNTLARPVLFDYRHYNQDLTAGSLLIEVGGHANSLSQAVYAGELTAQAVSEALCELSEERNG